MAFEINDEKVLMGWNQLVTIDFSTSDTDTQIIDDFNEPVVLRVSSYEIGLKQEAEAPDFVTGKQDRTAWKKGPITSDGTIEYPFTLPKNGQPSVGFSFFKAAALLATKPQGNFTIRSSVHPVISGCKVNTVTLSCEAGAEVRATAQVWGVADPETLPELVSVNSYSDETRVTYGGSEDSIGQEQGGVPTGVGLAENSAISTIELEQIPQWDVCRVVGAPAGMRVVGWSITIDNQLKRNYTMGDGSTPEEAFSPLGLNATSISANQRRITGSVTWQSDKRGYISQILATGLTELIIQIGPIKLSMNNVVWNANPARLSTGDRITVESSFTALGTGGGEEFNALEIEEGQDFGNE